MFPFHKEPPSKVEIVKKGVSDAAHALLDAVPTEKIEDKLDDLKKTAAQVALHAAQVAHHAGEIAAHKVEDLQHSASALGETASSAAHQVTESAAARAQAARESAQHAREALQERTASLKGSAASLKDNWHHRAANAAEDAQEEAREAAKVAEKTAKREAKEARAAAEAAQDKVSDKKAEREARARDKAREFDESDLEIEVSETHSKWLWIVLGLAAGALLVFLLAPTTGRRRRAAIKDRLGKVSEGVTDAATAASDKAVDIAHRVEGLAHQIETKITADAGEASSDDDTTITDRVRSVLGHHEVSQGMERLNIDCVDGIVTLRGPMLDEATQQTLIAAVKAVPGVQEVVADFLTDEEPANPSTYAS